MDALRMQSPATAAAPTLDSGKEGKQEQGALTSPEEEIPSRALLGRPRCCGRRVHSAGRSVGNELTGAGADAVSQHGLSARVPHFHTVLQG